MRSATASRTSAFTSPSASTPADSSSADSPRSPSPIGQDSFNFFAACGSQIKSMAFGSETMFNSTHFFGDNNGTVTSSISSGSVNYSGTHDVASDVTAMVSSPTA
ncbi:MAG: hypothetical protein R3B67_00290 [Phycisphaerales bacterium]